MMVVVVRGGVVVVIVMVVVVVRRRDQGGVRLMQWSPSAPLTTATWVQPWARMWAEIG